MEKKVLMAISESTLPSEFQHLQDKFSINVQGEHVYLKYPADSLNPKAKRALEDYLYQVLGNVVREENLFIMSESTKSRPAAPKAAPAQVKAGHGPSANKKRVAGVKRLIAVSSNKGGVGKSTVAANLAVSLGKLGHKVGLLDADIYGPSSPIMMGKRAERPAANEQKRIMPVKAHGISFISFGLFVKEEDAVVWRGPMLGGVLNQFLFDVEWGELDYLIIDLPPGTGDMQLSLTQLTEVDGVITVTTPQEVALLDSQKGAQMFGKLNIPLIGIVENMSYFICDSCDQKHMIFGDGGAEKMAKQLGLELLGQIPLELDLRKGGDEGSPFMANQENEGRLSWKSYVNISKGVNNYFQK